MDPRILVLRKVEAQGRIKTAVHALTKMHGLKLNTDGLFARSNDPAVSELLFLQGYADFTESLLEHFEKVGASAVVKSQNKVKA